MHVTAPCACTTLRKASRAVTRLYDGAMEAHGLTITQFALLRRLLRDGPTPLSRLADRLVTERTALYRMIAPLEARRLVAVTAQGARTRIAALTAEGEALLAASDADWEAVQRRFLDAFGQERWEEFQAMLIDATAAAEQVAG